MKKREAATGKAEEPEATVDSTPKSRSKKLRRSRHKVDDSCGDSASESAPEDKQQQQQPASTTTAATTTATTTTTTTATSTAASDKSSLAAHIPDDIRYNPNSLENKPKGLVDALSSFFTPGLKRTSRTAMNSLLKPEQTTPSATNKSDNSSASTTTTTSTSDSAKKVRLSVDEKETAGSGETEADRKRHASAGQQQVKSLYDGLSHLYSDCDSRLRSVPMTNYNEKAAASGTGGPPAGGDPSAKSTSPERMSSPHRMSDSELKEKELAVLKKEGGGKEKGTSKEHPLALIACFALFFAPICRQS